MSEPSNEKRIQDSYAAAEQQHAQQLGEQVPQLESQPALQDAPQSVANRSTSGLAIAGLVVGIVSILTSFLPIINNASFFLAIVGVILSIVGLVGVNKGKHSGKGIAIAGVVLGVLAIVVVLATQAMYSSALNSLSNQLNAGSTPTASASGSAASSSSASAAAKDDTDYQNLAIGSTVNLKSGLSVTVNSIEGGYTNYDGSEIVCVNVTYANKGNKNVMFNTYDWKAQDADGALRMPTIYLEGDNNLSSGQLASGGQVTGNLYFDAPVMKAHYYGNIASDSSTAAWVA